MARSKASMVPLLFTAASIFLFGRLSLGFVPGFSSPRPGVEPAGSIATKPINVRGFVAARAAEGRAAPVEEQKEENLMEKVKRYGPAGIASYAITEGAFWVISIPAVAFFYAWSTGEWPNMMNGEDQAKVFGASFVFLNFARLVVPLRVGLALALAPWVDENIIKAFFPDQWKAWQEQLQEKDAEATEKA